MKLVIFIVGLCFLISCSPTTAEPKKVENAPSNSASLDAASTQEPLSAPVPYSTDPNDIILQYDMLGGLMGPCPGTHIPLWTLYGDGLLVWSEDGPATPGFTNQIWVGHLNKLEIESLMTYVGEQGFWELDSSYQPDQFIEPTLSDEENPDDLSVIMPNPEAALDQPSSAILVSTYDKRHQVTVFPAGWTEAPDAYQNLLLYIQEIRPDDAKLFKPITFSLRAREMPQLDASDQRLTDWPFESVKLSEVVDTPIPLGDEQGISIAEYISASGQNVVQNEIVYIVTLLATPPRP